MRRWLRRLVLWPMLAFATLLALWFVVPPVSTLMLWNAVTGQGMDRRYVPVSQISPRLISAVINSEDARFCEHHGVDWGALEEVMADEDGPSRGASTITMQTVKNLFLWQGPGAIIRKGLEIPLAMVVDLVWPKRRIIEIYLNIAEWGPGIFGAEAAAQRHFGKAAADLSAREASLLAAALPNPILRNAGKPSAALQRRAARIMARAAGNPAAADCTTR